MEGTQKFIYFQVGQKCKGITYYYVESTIFNRFTSSDMNFEAEIIAEIVFGLPNWIIAINATENNFSYESRGHKPLWGGR